MSEKQFSFRSFELPKRFHKFFLTKTLNFRHNLSTPQGVRKKKIPYRPCVYILNSGGLFYQVEGAILVFGVTLLVDVELGAFHLYLFPFDFSFFSI